MKVHIFFNMTEPVARLKQLACARNAQAQALDQVGGDRRGADRVNLESFAKSVEIHDFLKGRSYVHKQPRRASIRIRPSV